MTEINGTIKREVTGVTGDVFTVEIKNEGIYIREKGSRTTFGPLSWSAIYLKAAQQKADADRREKATQRSVKRFTRSLI